MKVCRLGLALALSCAMSGAARADISDNLVRVGVLNDISGIFQDTNGMGSVEAARMAAEDFNGGGKGIKVEIVYADHQNKADVGSAIVRKWLDVERRCRGDVPNSASASPSIRCCRRRMTFSRVDGELRPDRRPALPPHQWVNDAWPTGIPPRRRYALGGKELFYHGPIRARQALRPMPQHIEKPGAIGWLGRSAQHPFCFDSAACAYSRPR